MATRNGWTSAPPLRTAITAPGCADTGQVRAGDVATVFQHFTNAFDAQVEPVVTINGYRTLAYNASVGGDPSSNHLSATALDLNGNTHPYERALPVSQRGSKFKHGFTAAQVATIRALLARYGGVLFWGLDFNTGYRDPMHFEIRGTASDARRVAAQLAAPKPAPAPAPTPTPATPATEDDMIPLIERAYNELNDRPGSLSEVANWFDAARSGGWSAQGFLETFTGSPAEEGTVRAAYKAIMGRAPESASVITYWMTGRTIAQVWAGIAAQKAGGAT